MSYYPGYDIVNFQIEKKINSLEAVDPITQLHEALVKIPNSECTEKSN
jgi:hypothetical protein